MPRRRRVQVEKDGQDQGRLLIDRTTYLDMTGWPGTVTRDRMNMLIQIVRDLLQGQAPEQDDDDRNLPDDCLGLVLAARANQFGQQVRGRMMDLPEDPDREWEEIFSIIGTADTQESIGGIIVIQGEGEDEDRKGRVPVMIPRHPRWMGACRALPLVEDLKISILESEKRPGLPGLVVAAPDSPGDPTMPDTMFPQGRPSNSGASSRGTAPKAAGGYPRTTPGPARSADRQDRSPRRGRENAGPRARPRAGRLQSQEG